jgi:hypothetical protein
MSVCCECCVLSVRGLCVCLITPPEESYRLRCVVVCDLETSRMRWPWSAWGGSAKGGGGIINFNCNFGGTCSSACTTCLAQRHTQFTLPYQSREACWQLSNSDYADNSRSFFGKPYCQLWVRVTTYYYYSSTREIQRNASESKFFCKSWRYVHNAHLRLQDEQRIRNLCYFSDMKRKKNRQYNYQEIRYGE